MQINDSVAEKLLKRLDKLESQVYYLEQFKKEAEEKEYTRKHKEHQKFLDNLEKIK